MIDSVGEAGPDAPAPSLWVGILASQCRWTWQQYVGDVGLCTHARSADASVSLAKGTYTRRKCWATLWRLRLTAAEHLLC